MQTRRGARNSHILSDGLLDGAASSSRKVNGCATIPISSSASLSSPSSGVSFIEHRVSKMDTLAGVAIKYGVEVADIKRMNSLVTDIQMYGHKSLQIPLPGKHPPSSVMSNGSTQNGDKTPPRRISPAMCSLQGFYGLAQPEKSLLPQGTEMAIYNSGKPPLHENKRLSESPISDPILGRHRKSRSLVNFISLENGDSTQDRSTGSGAEPVILLKEESTVGTFSGRTGKGMALRPKSGSRMDLEASRRNSSSPIDSLADVFVLVRKSSSTSNLSDSENSSSSSIWPTNKWSPKPITAWRNKAAFD